MDRTTEIFEQHRPFLFHVAYGMLGGVALAEDMVQEAWLRWQQVDQSQINSERAYLSTIVSRLCLDELKSARNRKEEYIGPFLPEPLVESDKRTPEEMIELADSLSMAMLVLLESLTPVQRAVFLLHEVFSYDYSTIADIIGKSEAHCRKIAQRARKHIKEQKPRFEPKKEDQRQLVESFMSAINNGSVKDLEQMLASEAILYSDGGGKVTAARKPIYGSERIIRFLLGIMKNPPPDTTVEFREVNGRPGMMVFLEGRLYSVWSFRVEKHEIQNIYIVLNPEKLGHLAHIR